MWKEIVESFTSNPRDVKSIPITKRTPVWFYVYMENGRLYVEGAKDHIPSSNISTRRLLSPKNNMVETMFDIYQRRKSGEPVSAEATAATVNQIYWYGIFADMGF